MLLFCYISTQSFVHNKSSSISQFIKRKSRDLQKLLRYFSGIMTSILKVRNGGRFASPSFPDLSRIFPTIIALNSNDLPSEALSSTSSVSSL